MGPFRIYLDGFEDEDVNGDCVVCKDCGTNQIIQIGGTACGNCESENLEWVTKDDGTEIHDISYREFLDMLFEVK